METASLDGRETVLRHTDEFIAASRVTPVVRRFAEATRRYEADQEVQALMEKLRRFQQAQQTGGALPAELQDVRDAQMRVRNHPAVQEVFAARDAVGAFFQETNLVISEVLGLDFGQTAGPAADGCC
jgi:cell fate (sporulation/competence/biofilm development) regulator YlbF (YheA/YmcA/DUF963 family)